MHGVREHGRKVTQEVEIRDSVKLSTGISYRFTPVAVKDGSASQDYSGTPRGFRDPQFSPGERILMDFDPGYQLFFYPAGRYPRVRLWPVALAATVIGAGTAALGVLNLLLTLLARRGDRFAVRRAGISYL